jgi:hypothetical protein
MRYVEIASTHKHRRTFERCTCQKKVYILFALAPSIWWFLMLI